MTGNAPFAELEPARQRRSGAGGDLQETNITRIFASVTWRGVRPQPNPVVVSKSSCRAKKEGIGVATRGG
jgi:hypothetical protein